MPRAAPTVPFSRMSVPACIVIAPLPAIGALVEMLPPVAVSAMSPTACIAPLMPRFPPACSVAVEPATTLPVVARSCAAASDIVAAAVTSCSDADPPACVCTVSPRSEPVKRMSPPDCSVAA